MSLPISSNQDIGSISSQRSASPDVALTLRIPQPPATSTPQQQPTGSPLQRSPTQIQHSALVYSPVQYQTQPPPPPRPVDQILLIQNMCQVPPSISLVRYYIIYFCHLTLSAYRLNGPAVSFHDAGKK